MVSKEKYYGVARILSKRGVCSRKEAEQACRDSRVRLNDKLVLDPETPARVSSKIFLDGKLTRESKKIYIAFNKPKSVISTTKDPNGRKTILDYFPPEKIPRVAPVGRLDAASEGLILLTNDTDFANKILSPKFHLTKIYHVQIKGRLSEEALSFLEKGFWVPPRIYNGSPEFMKAKRAKILRAGERNSWLEIHLDEGKNREIRRMLKQLRHETLRLVRVQIGNLKLGDLKPGNFKILTKEDFPELKSDE